MRQICPFISVDVDSCAKRIMGKFKTTSSCVYRVILSQLFHNIFTYMSITETLLQMDYCLFAK